MNRSTQRIFKRLIKADGLAHGHSNSNRRARRRCHRACPSIIESLEIRTLLSAAVIQMDLTHQEAVPQLASFANGPNGLAQFSDTDRWSLTATNRDGLRQGDATTLTWGIVPDGTFIGGFGFGAGGDSDLISFFDDLYGGGEDGSDVTERPWFGFFEDSFARYSELSGLTFVYEPNDDGHRLSSATGWLGTRPDIRLSGRFLDGNSDTLAFAFFPNDGDMVIDTSERAFFGRPFNDARGLRNVVMHELGHGLGFEHITSHDARFLMESVITNAIDGPQFDDILAIQRAYGDSNESGIGNDSTDNATDLGTIADETSITIGADANDKVVARTDTDFVSIDDDSDVDFYRFTITAKSLVDVTLTPMGPSYHVGPEGQTQSAVEASALSDLDLQIFDADGNQVTEVINENGLGDRELVSDLSLELGDYFVRISGADNTVQLYQLDISVEHGDPVPILSISATDAIQSEGDADDVEFSFTVTRSNVTTGSVTVDFAVVTAGGTLADANDFGGALPSGTVSFADGETTQVATILVSGDTDVEGDEEFRVMLSNASGGSLIDLDSAAGTILNDDIDISISAVDSVMAEGDSELTAFTFSVSRVGDLSQVGTVDFVILANGENAADSLDFGGELPSGIVSFDANQSSSNVTIEVSGDVDIEPDEEFQVVLSNASGNAEITTTNATGTILNDDREPGSEVELSIEATAAVRPEGDSPENTLFTFTVTRSGDLSATTSVDYVVAGDETAVVNAEDFGGTMPAGTIVFSAGEASVEITIGVSGDDQVEVDENFTVMLESPSLDAIIVNAESVGTILSDDSGAVIFERTVLLVGTDGRDNITVVKSPRRFRTLLILTLNDLVNQDRRRFRLDINDVDDIVVLARGGNDRVSVATDIIIPLTADGGDGRDTLSGGSGADLLFGGSGNDRISGRSGNDILIGGDDNDLLRGGSGDDELFGNGGNDVLNGGRGHDTISAGMGNDVALGGSGNDLIDGGAGDDRLRGGSDDDAIRGGIGNDFLNGNAGSDQLDGDESEDTLRGDAATDLDELFADIEELDQLILPW